LGGGAHLGVRLDTKKVHKGEQVNAIAANFIHSQDASHLHLTVTAMTKDMKSRGQTPSFSFIHDSYATHAKDTPLLAKTLRKEFVRMYEDNNPLEQFKLANQYGMSGVFQLSFIKFGPEEDVTPALMEKVTKELKKVKLRKNQKTGPCELLIDRGKLKEMEDFTRNIQPVLDEADVTMEVTNLPAGSLPDYPESGELDLQTVLQSVYFFG
jgi:DNA-directed RNA polymerase